MILNYDNFDTFMASRLFKIQKENVDDNQYKSYFERSEFFKPELTTNLKEYWMDTMPEKIVCCKRNRTQRGIQKALEALNQEIDIIELIKSRRYFKMALRHLLPPKVRMELKERSRYISVDPDAPETKIGDNLMEMNFAHALD